MKHTWAKSGSLFILLIFLFTTGAVVHAENSTTSTKAPSTERPRTTETPKVSPLATANAHLEEAKQKICAIREKGIKTLSEIMEKRGDNMLAKFSTVADKVENYYTTKVLPTGKVVTNYSALVADIAAKKATTQADITAAAATLGAFSCTGEHPKDKLSAFSTAMQKVDKDLKDYRVSIKNLIKAIRTVVGDTATPSAATQSSN